MKRTFAILTVTLLLLGLVGATWAAASPVTGQRPAGEPSADRLRLIGEETGLVASEQALSPDCYFDKGYQVYLCPQVAAGTHPQRDPAAAARVKTLLASTGLLLVPESTNDRVMAFDPTTGDLVDANFVPSDPTNLSTPIHAILSAGGDSILVSDQLNDVVQEYDLDGNFLGTFAPAGGPNPTILDNVRGIALRSNGNLLVTVGSGANARLGGRV